MKIIKYENIDGYSIEFSVEGSQLVVTINLGVEDAMTMQFTFEEEDSLSVRNDIYDLEKQIKENQEVSK